MSEKYVNFYENLKEAKMRIEHTVVMYDGKPYYVLAVCDHKPDGIFRVYLDDLSSPAIDRYSDIPIHYAPAAIEDPSHGQMMDKWMEKRPNAGVIRKMMNSPLFNKFRPFPLGMCNYGKKTYYLERGPSRPHSQQGLTKTMLHATCIDPSSGSKGSIPLSLTSKELYRTIIGDYPTAKECLDALKDPTVLNTSVGFHRNFAFSRGPAGIIFLAYKTDIVGFLPERDLSSVVLDRSFAHTKEVVEDLSLFSSVLVN